MFHSDLTYFVPNQLPHVPPLSFNQRLTDRSVVWTARPFGAQSSGGCPAKGASYIIRLDEISERAQERGEWRRLRTLAAFKTQAPTSNSREVEPPGAAHASKRQPPVPPYTPTETSDQPSVQSKLTCKPSNNPRVARYPQPDIDFPLTIPIGSHRTPTHEPRIPYSESRGELRRQFATSQRLQCEHYLELHNLGEVDDRLNEISQPDDAGTQVHGLRVHPEKLLQKVATHRGRRSDKRNVAHLGEPKKVRFSTVVECFEF